MKNVYLLKNADGSECNYYILSKKEWKEMIITLPADGSVLYRKLNIFQIILFQTEIGVAILIDLLRDGNK